jgi:hypothetical protein
MVSGHTQVVDAAFVEANASTDSLKRKALLEWQLHTGEAKQITAADLFGQDSPFTALEKTDKPKSCARNNRSHISMSDPEAKLSQKTGKPSRLYYLSSMAVDTYRHVITHIQADLADEKDSRHLIGIVDKLSLKLKQYGLPFQYLLADAGFSSGENGPATSVHRLHLPWRHATSMASFRYMVVTIRIDHGIGSIKGRI